MNKTIAIHQPNFIPWLGYFYKWMNCDLFILLDDVQYSRRSFINRNKIKTPQGEKWITIPVMNKGNYYQKINEAKISNDSNWQKKILGSIKANYSKSPFYSKYFPKLNELLTNRHESLVELNIALLIWTSSELGIEIPYKRSSDLKKVNKKSTERLISICKAVGADSYFSGFGGEKYQNQQLFEKNRIKLVTSDFVNPVYPQLWGSFVDNLSVLDLMFNCGENSKKYILNRH